MITVTTETGFRDQGVPSLLQAYMQEEGNQNYERKHRTEQHEGRNRAVRIEGSEKKEYEWKVENQAKDNEVIETETAEARLGKAVVDGGKSR